MKGSIVQRYGSDIHRERYFIFNETKDTVSTDAVLQIQFYRCSQ